MAEEFEVRTISVTALDGPHWHFGIGRLPQEAGPVYTGSQRDSPLAQLPPGPPSLELELQAIPGPTP